MSPSGCVRRAEAAVGECSGGCRIRGIAINKRMFASDAMSVSLVMGHDGEGDAFAGRMQTKEKGGRRGIRSTAASRLWRRPVWIRSE